MTRQPGWTDPASTTTRLRSGMPSRWRCDTWTPAEYAAPPTDPGRFPQLSDERGEVWKRFKVTEQSRYVFGPPRPDAPLMSPWRRTEVARAARGGSIVINALLRLPFTGSACCGVQDGQGQCTGESRHRPNAEPRKWGAASGSVTGIPVRRS